MGKDDKGDDDLTPSHGTHFVLSTRAADPRVLRVARRRRGGPARDAGLLATGGTGAPGAVPTLRAWAADRAGERWWVRGVAVLKAMAERSARPRAPCSWRADRLAPAATAPHPVAAPGGPRGSGPPAARRPAQVKGAKKHRFRPPRRLLPLLLARLGAGAGRARGLARRCFAPAGLRSAPGADLLLRPPRPGPARSPVDEQVLRRAAASRRSWGRRASPAPAWAAPPAAGGSGSPAPQPSAARPGRTPRRGSPGQGGAGLPAEATSKAAPRRRSSAAPPGPGAPVGGDPPKGAGSAIWQTTIWLAAAAVACTLRSLLSQEFSARRPSSADSPHCARYGPGGPLQPHRRRVLEPRPRQ